ncbi:hypothetical protein [Pseudogracilibacillus sp. SO10305]|uniref:hypothetical protein n=1 Tax=Pseudogracilibacillus sp. SO10305 TaxID=3098292 RepID=UPI00300E3CAF
MKKTEKVQVQETGFITLKDYIADYQSKGMESTALNQLIIVSIDGENGTKVTFRDKSLNFIFNGIIKEYGGFVSYNDLLNFFINGLYERVFDKADLRFEPAQIVNWASDELFGFVTRKVNTEIQNVDQVLSESYITKDGTEQTHYDDVAYDEYFNILRTDNKFERYIKSLGGLDKILTSRQLEIYNLSNIEGATHQSIADELGVSKQAVTKAIATAKNKVKKEFLNWKIMNQLHSNRELYDVVRDYLDSYAKIATFDVTDLFDYFGFTIQYFKDNVNDYEEDIADVLMDNATKANRTLLLGILNNKVYENYEEVTFTKRQQDQFVMGTIRAFNDYIKNVGKSVDGFSDNVVHLADNTDGYKKVAELF